MRVSMRFSMRVSFKDFDEQDGVSIRFLTGVSV